MPGCLYDCSLSEFPRLAGETDDSMRIQRAAEATPNGGVLFFPKGVYEIASTVNIDKDCSLLLHKSARLKAVREIDFLLVWKSPHGEFQNINNNFIKGGIFDGAGLASCLNVLGFVHATVENIHCVNGKKYGLLVGTTDTTVNNGYELVAKNVYCSCNMPELAGNTGIYIGNGDSHYSDCVVVNYTVGMHLAMGSLRLTRCHVWSTIREILKNSICFRISAPDATLTDCYADTAEIGFKVENDTRLRGCTYLADRRFPLDKIVVVDHVSGRLTVNQGSFRQVGWDDAYLYRGTGENLYWNDCTSDLDRFVDHDKWIRN